MESTENGEAVFPSFPQTLEIDKADSHIPTATTSTGPIQKEKVPKPSRYGIRILRARSVRL
jgi:hypothetical protein